MTPSMGMAAPKGTQAPQAPQAGLAALAQPAIAPKGKSPENMGQVMALARKMSDAQLADVLAGKSLDIPQYVAMTEAMGRRQLRTAMQGAQAMGQMKQPSVKDKLLAEEAAAQMPAVDVMGNVTGYAEGGLMYGGGGAIDMNETANSGLAMLPAMNMMPLTMADGGIVAFNGENDSLVEARNPLAVLNPGDLYEKLKNYIKEKQAAVPPTPLQAQLAAAGEAHPSSVPAPTAEQTAAFMGDVPPAPTLAAAPKTAPKKSGLEALVGGTGGGGGAPTSYDQAKKDYREDYLASLANLSTKQREGLAQIRKESGGEALMQLAAGILGRPTLQQGLAAGLPLVASTAAASRKEQRDIERTANDYDLNLAKARAALQEGDKDRALKYQQLASEDRYRMLMANKPDSAIALLNALKDPKMMELYQQMNVAKKPTDVLSRKDAEENFNKYPALKREYGDFETYYRARNNQLLSDTIPGQGANIRPYS